MSMDQSSREKVSNHRRAVVLSVFLLKAAMAPCGALHAQDRWSEPAQDPRDPNLRAKAELENPEPERGPVPEDNDPDVAKRPGLHTALNKNRVWTGMPSVFTRETFLTAEKVPASAKDTLRKQWEKVVAAQFLPSREEDIEWRGANDYPTAPEQRSLAARWTTPVGTFIADGIPISNGLNLCLQLSGDDRLTFRFLRRDTEGAAAASRPEDLVPQDILDKPRLLEILTTYLRFPFQSVDEFRVISGPSGTYDGVRIFSGSIRWAHPLPAGAPDFARLGRHSETYNEAKLGITDSDPQYLCIGIAIGG